MIPHITNAINNLVGNAASFQVHGDTYEDIVWLDEKIIKPSKSLVVAEFIRLQSEYDAKQYQRDRVCEYPAISDQLDALWKGGDDAEEMLAKVQAVKAKYPKPE